MTKEEKQKQSKNLKTNKNGITLIALVITIIIMLILVAVTVTVALKGGLFSTSKQAKSDIQGEINAEQTLADRRVKIDGVWYDSTEKYLEGTPSEDQNTPAYADAKKNDNGILEENAKFTDTAGTAVVPKGFKVVEGIDGTKSIAEGLVIQDEEGNEFVWIPVNYNLEEGEEKDANGLYPNFLEVFYRSNWSNNARGTKYDSTSDYTEPFSKGTGYTREDTDYYDMMKSVQENKGFYIGRYEAGSETARTSSSATTAMVVQRDQYPYNYVTWGKSMGDIDAEISSSGHGAVYLSKHMYDNKDVGVISTLCYGVQWDAMLDFIKVTNNVTDSTSWGNCKNNEFSIDRTDAKYYTASGGWKKISEEGIKTKTSSEAIFLTTGASDDFAAKNIYNVAGNCWEWTMEAYSTSTRVVRGRYL